MSYTMSITDQEIHIFADDQVFTEEDLKELWVNNKIYFIPGSIIGLWVQERKTTSPLVHLMHEDDGQIFWFKEFDVAFDAAWLDSFANTMAGAKKALEEDGLI